MPPQDDVLSFEEALERSGEPRQRKILLGNGFSRAFRDDIFAYDSLFERAEPVGLSPGAWEAFDTFGTTDFELVMRALQRASRLVALYEGEDSALAARLASDAEALREILVSTIATSHPEYPGEIATEAYEQCRRFLEHFSNIYTLNYDLLLYWVLMQQELAPVISCDDGFRTPEEGETTYVTWEPDAVRSQNVFYLHGALHLFDAGSELQKYTWINTGIRLIDQVREAMEQGLFPVFVAEGSSREKLERIRHSAYLSRAERSLYNMPGTLFTYGFAFGDPDAHILKAIRKSSVTALWVGLYGDPESDSNEEVALRARSVADASRRRMSVNFYSAETAQVWGPN